MLKAFKFLRIATAMALLSWFIYQFAADLYYQSKALLDGPLSRPMHYSFAINKIIFACIASFVLICDFKIELSPRAATTFKFAGVITLLLSLVSLAFVIEQHVNSGPHRAYFDFYLEKITYILMSIVIITKGFEETVNA